jgi:3-oxoacyl-[acyl-carrier-protein] synthase II
MTAPSVAGIGWVTAGGPGRGRCGAEFSLSPGPLPRLARRDVFPEPNPRFGRLPDYCRAGLAAVAFALRDAGLERWEAKRPIGIVASTRLGCLSVDIEYFATVLQENGNLSSPNLFAHTLPTSFLGEAAIQFGLTGPTWVVNDASGDDLAGVRAAVEQLSRGERGALLAGHIDIPPGPPLSWMDPPASGAVFLALANGETAEGPGFGNLDLSDGETLRHDAIPVGNLAELVRSCLNKDPRTKREPR